MGSQPEVRERAKSVREKIWGARASLLAAVEAAVTCCEVSETMSSLWGS